MIRDTILSLVYVAAGVSACIGAGAAILIAAKVETRNIERDREPTAAHAATDVGVEP